MLHQTGAYVAIFSVFHDWLSPGIVSSASESSGCSLGFKLITIPLFKFGFFYKVFLFNFWYLFVIRSLPNLFQDFRNLNRRCLWWTWLKCYIPGVEYTQISSDILLNGFMTAEQKMMRIFSVQDINYYPKGYRHGRLAML
jgi:hypothetical protein